MKTVITTLIVLSLLLAATFLIAPSKEKVIMTAALNIPAATTVEKRGCCSWHGGVCGCENGRVLCCDGTLSPTCTCDE